MRAGLNCAALFGDALAKVPSVPWPFKGDDVAKTDVIDARRRTL